MGGGFVDLLVTQIVAYTGEAQRAGYFNRKMLSALSVDLEMSSLTGSESVHVNLRLEIELEDDVLNEALLNITSTRITQYPHRSPFYANHTVPTHSPLYANHTVLISLPPFF